MSAAPTNTSSKVGAGGSLPCSIWSIVLKLNSVATAPAPPLLTKGQLLQRVTELRSRIKDFSVVTTDVVVKGSPDMVQQSRAMTVRTKRTVQHSRQLQLKSEETIQKTISRLRGDAEGG